MREFLQNCVCTMPIEGIEESTSLDQIRGAESGRDYCL